MIKKQLDICGLHKESLFPGRDGLASHIIEWLKIDSYRCTMGATGPNGFQKFSDYLLWLNNFLKGGGMLRRVIISLFLFIGVEGLAVGNGATIGRMGETVFPLFNKDVQMVSESVSGAFVSGSNEAYEINCVFSFLNLTKESMTIEMGFPIHVTAVSESDLEKPREASDSDIVVLVEGKKVPVMMRGGSVNRDLGIGEYYPLIFVFPVEFKPNEKKRVEVKYFAWFATGDDDFISGQTFRYVAKTGSLWAKSIGSAKFQFALPNFYEYPGSIIHLFGEPQGYRISDGNMSWEFRDWKPEEDVLVRAEIGHLDALLAVEMREHFEAREYLADKRLYSDKDFEYLPVREYYSQNAGLMLKSVYLWVLRNEIFARHGYKFSNPVLAAYFSDFTWYSPRDGVSDDAFSDLEKKNLNAIKRQEKNLHKKHHIRYNF